MELEENGNIPNSSNPETVDPTYSMTLIYRSYDSDYNSLISDYTSLKAAH